MSLEQALVDAARHIFATDRDNVTVNAVRKHVAADRGLADDYFKSDAWKEKSKQVITDEVSRLMEGDDDEEEAELEVKPKTKPKAVPKKAAPKKAAPKPKAKAAPKKRKARAASESEDDDDDESDLSEPSEDSFGDDDEDEAEETENSDNDSDAADSPKRKRARTKKDTAIPSRPAKTKAVAKPTVSADSPKNESDVPMADVDTHKAEEPTPAADDSDSMSSVINDPPPKKRGKAGAKAAKPRPKAEPKTKAAKKDAAAMGPDEAEIKKLQGQLVKCGVRKIWAFELRSYGDDTKAKIRHLRGVLSEIGMDGRFSEARAREIKVRRELAADLEAVQEMDKNWGVGGRSSRTAARQRKSLKESSDEDDKDGDGAEDDGDDGDDFQGTNGKTGADNDDDDDDDDDDEASPAPKARPKRSNGLAFLDDLSESD